MLCGTCSTYIEVVIAILWLLGGKDKDVPLPWALEIIACGLPCIDTTVVNLKHGLTTCHAFLRGLLALEELHKKWNRRGFAIHYSIVNGSRVEIRNTTGFINQGNVESIVEWTVHYSCIYKTLGNLCWNFKSITTWSWIETFQDIPEGTSFDIPDVDVRNINERVYLASDGKDDQTGRIDRFCRDPEIWDFDLHFDKVIANYPKISLKTYLKICLTSYVEGPYTTGSRAWKPLERSQPTPPFRRQRLEKFRSEAIFADLVPTASEIFGVAKILVEPSWRLFFAFRAPHSHEKFRFATYSATKQAELVVERVVSRSPG